MTQKRTVDPVTIEILSHRLHQIAKEMGTTLELVGGTVNTTQMHDYMASLYRANGEILATGESMPWHVACAGFTVKQIMERFATKGGGINPDDVFLLNDPYVSAIHQSDVYIISPIHYEEVLVGWSASFVHVMDIGAMTPGGETPAATEITQEGLRIPGVKLVDRGELREDVFDMIINMTRRPEMVALDINCQLAGNNVAKRRIQELYARFGHELMDDVGTQMIDDSEQALRRRLRDVPDGTWNETGDVESGEQHWRMMVKLQKTGDELLFDFTGTDKQATTGINLPYHATFGCCFDGIVSTLAYDLPKNHGLFKPIKAVVPPGTLLNVTYPAPVSLNTTSGGAMAKFLVHSVLLQMLAGSEAWRHEVIAPSLGGRLARTAGVNQHGVYYASSLAQPALSGSGGLEGDDGVDSSALTYLIAPNVEWMEANCPLLFLFRRHAVDAQGPGKFRGGAGAEMAFTIHKAPEGEITGVAFGVAGLRNAGRGVYGGYPAAPSVLVLHTDTEVQELLENNHIPESMDELHGDEELLGYTTFKLTKDDVLYYSLRSGGGFGDPLERDPALIEQDLQDGFVSLEAAKSVYGVVPNEGSTEKIDFEATADRREQIRTDRLEAKS
jgi:N-methylhydantoinase B